jgi:hypothetical protein
MLAVLGITASEYPFGILKLFLFNNTKLQITILIYAK